MNLVNTFHEAAVEEFGRSKVQGEHATVEPVPTRRSREISKKGRSIWDAVIDGGSGLLCIHL